MARPTRLIASALLALTLSASGLATAYAQPTPEADRPAAPRYLAAIRGTLEAMRLAPVCETLSSARARCEVRHVDAEARREITLTLVYSDATDTLYLFVPRFLLAAPGDATTPAVLSRLMELNHHLLGPKLEWNPATGEVRLSALLHTDSNLDLRALRSMVLTLFSVADRYQPELERLLASED